MHSKKLSWVIVQKQIRWGHKTEISNSSNAYQFFWVIFRTSNLFNFGERENLSSCWVQLGVVLEWQIDINIQVFLNCFAKLKVVFQPTGRGYAKCLLKNINWGKIGKLSSIGRNREKEHLRRSVARTKTIQKIFFLWNLLNNYNFISLRKPRLAPTQSCLESSRTGHRREDLSYVKLDE